MKLGSSVVLLCAAVLASGNGWGKGKGEDGTDAVREYLGRDMIFMTAPGLQRYLQDIASKLLSSQQGVPVPRFLIQSTDEFSVFTDTRGNIVVGSEVLRQVESEDELAAAISHELAHVIEKHAQTKNVVQKLPFTIETAHIVALTVDGREKAAGSTRAGDLSGFASRKLATTQAAGTVWSDLVSPSWNRKQERDADLAGVDMVRAAGYDPAAFSSLLARVDAAHAVRSERVELLRQEALKQFQSMAPGANAGIGDSILDGLKSSAGSAAVEAAFQQLAGFGTDYDDPEERTTAILEHVQKTSTGRRDKTLRSPRFDAEVRSGANRQLLDADRAALTIMAGLNSRDPRSVKPDAEALLADTVLLGLSPHLNLAAGTWLDAVARKPAEAEQRAVAWLSSDVAPRSAYLWRASYQIQRREYANALATLERGADQLGDRELFLPEMIAAAKGSGDLDRADALGMECSRAGAGFNLTNIAKVATLLKQPVKEAKAPPPSGVYAQCVAALGYDPVERQQAALKAQPTAGQQKVPDFGKSFSDKLNKAMGNK